jgi:hypothetical protein
MDPWRTRQLVEGCASPAGTAQPAPGGRPSPGDALRRHRHRRRQLQQVAALLGHGPRQRLGHRALAVLDDGADDARQHPRRLACAVARFEQLPEPAVGLGELGEWLGPSSS